MSDDDSRPSKKPKPKRRGPPREQRLGTSEAARAHRSHAAPTLAVENGPRPGCALAADGAELTCASCGDTCPDRAAFLRGEPPYVTRGAMRVLPLSTTLRDPELRDPDVADAPFAAVVTALACPEPKPSDEFDDLQCGGQYDAAGALLGVCMLEPGHVGLCEIPRSRARSRAASNRPDEVSRDAVFAIEENRVRAALRESEAEEAERSSARGSPPSLPAPSVDDAGCVLYHGDCLDLLRAMPDASVDAVVTDPPYELTSAKRTKPAPQGAGPYARHRVGVNGDNKPVGGFMGKQWDGTGIAHSVELWREVLRVLKPGGHLLAFGGTRTYHRMVCAIEDAGFEIRDSIDWIYGSGFPKSLDLSKAIDKAAGAVREVVGSKVGQPGYSTTNGKTGSSLSGSVDGTLRDGEKECAITAPATDDARRWQGFGTALKPAHEPVVLARKPLVGTVAENVLAHGTGAIHVDGCRVDSGAPRTAHADGNRVTSIAQSGQLVGKQPHGPEPPASGRWPPNVLLTHSAACRHVGERRVATGVAVHRHGTTGGDKVALGAALGRFDQGTPDQTYASADGTEAVAAFECAPGCPVSELDRQSGTLTSGYSPGFVGEVTESVALGAKRNQIRPETIHADSGGASRFFPTFEWSTELDAAFDCAPGCPVAEMDRQSGERPSTLTGREDPRQRHDLPRTASPSGYSGGLLPAAVYADSGGASRFFPTSEWSAELDALAAEHAQHAPDDLDLAAAPFLYCGKASTEEREDGCEALPARERAVVGQKCCARCGRQAVNVSGACACPDPVWVEAAKHSPRKNHHATVKPVALMRWLVKLATPPGGVVLDPFAGSGTTLVAARLEGFRAVGFEREAEYVEVARGRVLRATSQRTIFDGAVPASARPAEEPTAPTPTQTTGPAPQLSLFGVPGGRAT